MLLGGTWFAFGALSAPQPARSLPLLDHDSLGDRVLVIAPHPDDEVIATGGLIQRALGDGRRVKVVVVTAGDGFKRAAMQVSGNTHPKPEDYSRMGLMRMQETREATRMFGLPAKDLVFLCYPDGGTKAMWERNWDHDHAHRGINGKRLCGYTFAYDKDSSYCGEHLVEDLSEIVRDYKPTAIVYPDPNDSHHDHWTVSAFSQYVMLLTGFTGAEYSYLVHREAFPRPRKYQPEMSLDPPYALKSVGTTWFTMPLTSGEERGKREATERFDTQLKSLRDLLEGFVRRNELYGTWTMQPVARLRSSEVTSWPREYDAIDDAESDSLLRVMRGSGDLTHLQFATGKSTALLGLSVRTQIDPTIRYMLRARLFDGRRFRHIDLELRDGRARALQVGANSTGASSDLEYHVERGRAWVELPSELFSGTTHIMLSAEAIGDDKKLIDRTATRVFTFERSEAAPPTGQLTSR